MMLPYLQPFRAGVLLAAMAAVASCGEPAAETDAKAEEAHVHAAQFGGVLVPLGDHFANVEVVHDAAAGTVKVYCLDGHAEGSERSPTESLELSLDIHADEPIMVTLAAYTSELSGEKAGDTSLFEGQDDALKGLDHFHGVISEVTLLGTKFENVKYDWPPEHDDHDGDDHDEDEHDEDHKDGEDGDADHE